MIATSNRRKRLTRGQRAEQLLDTAESLFSAQGYEATSMEDIAQKAGVTRAVVYAHYNNKEELLVAGVRRARHELNTNLAELSGALDAGTSISDVIEQGGLIFFRMLARDRNRWQLLFAPTAAFSTETHHELEVLRHETISRIADVAVHVPADVPAAAVEAYAYAVSGVGEQLGRWWIANPAAELDEVVGYYRDFIVSGLGSLSARS